MHTSRVPNQLNNRLGHQFLLELGLIGTENGSSSTEILSGNVISEI